eukprot:gene10754-7482_t
MYTRAEVKNNNNNNSNNNNAIPVIIMVTLPFAYFLFLSLLYLLCAFNCTGGIPHLYFFLFSLVLLHISNGLRINPQKSYKIKLKIFTLEYLSKAIGIIIALLKPLHVNIMARGNQRDLAREKAMKKQQEKTKGQRSDGLTPAQRKEADAERMRQKQAAALAKKEQGGS